jgi:hypothetical protein
MVRSWVESRRRARPDPLVRLAAATPGGETVAPAPLPVNANMIPVAPPVSPAVLPGRVQALVSVIRGIGSPLQSAVSEVASGQRERGVYISTTDEARAYAQLVQQVVSIGRTTCMTLEIGKDAIARWSGEPLRWALLEAISDCAGAHFRASGLMQPSGMVGQLIAAVTQIAIDGAKREDLMPGLGSATQARLALDMLKAVPPVVHAVARYSFGRNPLVLMTEVALEMQHKAVECTRRLLGSGSTLDEWHAVYGAFLISNGQQYAEAHFSEAERLSRLNQQERMAIGSGELPMTTVWETFDRKVDLLTNFAGHMAAAKPPAVTSGSAAITAADTGA